MGWSNGRLVPPPSVICGTFTDLARTGELQTHALATLCARRRRFLLRRRGRNHHGRDHGLFRAQPSPGRSDPAGAALDSLDRLGAAVHPVVRHLRSLQDHPDRGRRVLPGLSRRHGRGDVGRPQDRRSRPRLPAVGLRHGAAHPAARGNAGLCAVVARRARARLDVRGGGGIPGRLDRAGLPPDRRPAARQAGADRRRHRRLRHPRQDHRLAHRAHRRAVPALGGPLRAH